MSPIANEAIGGCVDDKDQLSGGSSQCDSCLEFQSLQILSSGYERSSIPKLSSPSHR